MGITPLYFASKVHTYTRAHAHTHAHTHSSAHGFAHAHTWSLFRTPTPKVCIENVIIKASMSPIVIAGENFEPGLTLAGQLTIMDKVFVPI